MFLYEQFYEIWIMQFVLLSRLKPDLCKNSGKLLKDFVCPSSRQDIQGNLFVCIM